MKGWQIMSSIFDSPEKQMKEKIAKERTKVFKKRFKPLEGTSGFTGSLFSSMVEWVGAKQKTPNLEYGKYINEQIDKEMSTKLAPRPRSVYIESAKKEVRKQAKRRRGYSSTIATRGALGSANIKKHRALGI